MDSKYEECVTCGQNLIPIAWRIEKETITKNGNLHHTGRTRSAISVLLCPRCGYIEYVDKLSYGPWSK